MEASVPPQNDADKVEDHAEVGPLYFCDYGTYVCALRERRCMLLPLKRNETTRSGIMFQVKYGRIVDYAADDRSSQY